MDNKLKRFIRIYYLWVNSLPICIYSVYACIVVVLYGWNIFVDAFYSDVIRFIKVLIIWNALMTFFVIWVMYKYYREKNHN